MKHAGCILDFTDQRNDELMAAYRKAVSKSGYIVRKDIAEEIVNSPCSRFWVSEERATVVVSAMMNGRDVLSSMRPLKREMFEEIYRRVMRLKDEHPEEQLFDLVMFAVNSPAEKFYMRPRCSIEIIYKIKNGFYDKQRKIYK